MAQNYIESGELLDYVLGAGEVFTSGEVVVIGALIGIALGSGIEGEKVTVKLTGVFEIDKTASLVINQGDTLYFSTSTNKVTKTVSDVLLGVAWEGAEAADAIVRVKLAVDRGASSTAKAANVPSVATANASDLATAQALANQLKTTLNEVLTGLKAAGIMIAD